MAVRIGVPRALLYYRYFPLWNAFFEGLGFEVVVSKPTHRKLIEEGFKFADDDTCIPIKMAFSHTINIKDQVDFLFIPRLLSLDPKSCCCPRMAGLPEMLKYSIPDLPPILDPYVDERYRNTRLSHCLLEMGLSLGKRSEEIKRAYQNGERALGFFREKMRNGEKVAELFPKHGKNGLDQIGKDADKKIAIVGHPYCLYDPYFNFNFLKILEEAQASLFTQERVSSEEIDFEIQKLGKDIYWTFGREILGASLHYLRYNQMDGLIYLTCFACGVDSMIEPLVNHRAKEDGRTLYLCLMIDEHTGAGGVLTRLEAFLETVERRKKRERTG